MICHVYSPSIHQSIPSQPLPLTTTTPASTVRPPITILKGIQRRHSIVQSHTVNGTRVRGELNHSAHAVDRKSFYGGGMEGGTYAGTVGEGAFFDGAGLQQLRFRDRDSS